MNDFLSLIERAADDPAFASNVTSIGTDDAEQCLPGHSSESMVEALKPRVSHASNKGLPTN